MQKAKMSPVKTQTRRINVQQKRVVAKAERELERMAVLRQRTDFSEEHNARETEGLRRLQIETEKMEARQFAPIRKPLPKKRSPLTSRQAVRRRPVMAQPKTSEPQLMPPPKRVMRKKGPLVKIPPGRLPAKRSAPGIATGIKKVQQKQRLKNLPKPHRPNGVEDIEPAPE